MTPSEVLEKVLQNGGKILCDGAQPRLVVPPALKPLVLEHRQALRELIIRQTGNSVTARIVGQNRIQECSSAEECWHCHGTKLCRCIVCAVPGPGREWIAGQCGSCLGTGLLARGVVQ